MMSQFNQKLLRLCAVLALYIGLLSGSVYIMQSNSRDGKISANDIISNEIKAVGDLKLIYHAQKQYHEVDWNQDGINVYAEFVAHLWQTVDQNADPVRNSLIPKPLAFAMGVSRAVHGYYFQSIHIKEIQNGGVSAGPKNHRQNFKSIDMDLETEWAIAAIPADYGRKGRLSFVVSSSGQIYAKDMQNRSVESVPVDFILAGWTEITHAMDIHKLHRAAASS